MKCGNVKCDIEHDGSFGGGKYCSRPCANSRIKSDEVRKKTSKSMKRAIAEGRAKKPIPKKLSDYSEEEFHRIVQKRKLIRRKKLLAADFSSLTFERLRERIVIEQENKCNKCKLDIWLDKPIVLELEHRDGNNKNNHRENLEMLCPNCHSLTDTWRGRNKGKSNKKRDAVKEEEIVRSYLLRGNIRQCLLHLGLAAKGSNYDRVKRVLTLWDIKY